MIRRLCSLVALAVVAVVLSASASSPRSGTLTTSSGSVRWSGGPITGIGTAGNNACTQVWCDEFSLTIQVPASSWTGEARGVAVRVQWEDPETDLDLLIYDSAGNEVAHSYQVAGTFEEAFILAPPPGTYTVTVQAFDGVAVSYEGTAALSSPGRVSLPTTANTMRFSPPTIVDPQVTGGEPGIFAARDGSLFVHSPSGPESLTSHLWRADAGTDSFGLLDSRITASLADPRRGPCTAAIGGGDADVVVDRTGRVYFADLEGISVNVAVSTNRGATWACHPVSAGTPLDDRPWLAAAPTADGADPAVDAYLSYTDSGTTNNLLLNDVKPFQVHFAVTKDGGSSWSETTTYARSLIHVPGRMFTTPDGMIVHVFAGENAVWMARSRDEGRTFEVRKISQRLGTPGNIFIAGDADEAGNLYVAWVDSGSFDLFYTVSRDLGDHWSEPRRVNPPSSDTALMPWLSAGRAGDVAIAWYGTPARVSPGAAPDATRWHAWVARSVRATTSSPRFEVAPLSETPVHFGQICLVGQSCSDPDSRSLLDFLQVDLAPDGAIVASFNDNGRLQDTAPEPYIMVVRQTGGLGLFANKSAASARERRGDVNAEGAGDSLDFLGTPTAMLRGNTVQVSFPIASAGDLSSALNASSSAISTAATWLVTWKSNDRLEYAAMRIARNGSTSFFGGDQPASASDIRVYPYLTYPEQFSLQGRVDVARGVVTIDVPLSAFHLKAGDTLHGLQAFSMAGNPATAEYVSQQLVDATPAQSVRIGAAPAPVLGARVPRGPVGRSLPATGVGDRSLAGVALALAGALVVWLGLTARTGRPRRLLR